MTHTGWLVQCTGLLRIALVGGSLFVSVCVCEPVRDMRSDESREAALSLPGILDTPATASTSELLSTHHSRRWSLRRRQNNTVAGKSAANEAARTRKPEGSLVRNPPPTARSNFSSIMMINKCSEQLSVGSSLETPHCAGHLEAG